MIPPFRILVVRLPQRWWRKPRYQVELAVNGVVFTKQVSDALDAVRVMNEVQGHLERLTDFDFEDFTIDQEERDV